MRILFLSTSVPVPINSGQAIRGISIIKALASAGHELIFVSFQSKNRSEGFYPLSEYCRDIALVEREFTNLSDRSDYLRRVLCLASGKPYALERFRSQPMQARIQCYLASERFDLIVCDSLYSLVNVPDTAVPIALNCHNVEYLIFERYAQIERDSLKRYYARFEARLMRAAERSSCRRAAISMVCSNVDRDTLLQLDPKLPVVVVPNTVDTESFRPAESHPASNAEFVILFHGSMDWYPNRDAVEFFVRKILPTLRAEYPGLKFVVAGRNPPASFVEEMSAEGNIEFTGTVPDMRPYLGAADVVVVPLRFGSGTRIKILEACAAGKPIVSTNIGAEGLGLEAGKEIIMADDPDEFAKSVTILLRDADYRSAVAKSARAKVVERYSHRALTKSLGMVFSDLIRDQRLAVEAK
jgi:polysaccharide biosynthesis protein PslH